MPNINAVKRRNLLNASEVKGGGEASLLGIKANGNT